MVPGTIYSLVVATARRWARSSTNRPASATASAATDARAPPAESCRCSSRSRVPSSRLAIGSNVAVVAIEISSPLCRAIWVSQKAIAADGDQRVQVPVEERPPPTPLSTRSTVDLVSAAAKPNRMPGGRSRAAPPAATGAMRSEIRNSARLMPTRDAAGDQPLADRRVVVAARGVDHREEHHQAAGDQRPPRRSRGDPPAAP